MADEEKTEQAEDKLSGFSGIDDAIEKFHDSLANKEEPSGEGESETKEVETEEKSTDSKEETKKETLPEDKGESEEKAISKAMEMKTDDEGFFVDKDGNRKPITIKVDGQDREIDTYEKLITHANFGYRADVRGEDLNRREAELQAKEPIVQALLKAQEEGRLVIKDPQAKATPEGEKPEAKTDYDLSDLDPDVAEVLGPVLKEVDKLKEDNKAMKELLTNQFIEKAHGELQSKVDAAMAKFPLARAKSGKAREAVWKKLSEVDETTGRAVHTPEEAVEIVHHEMQADFSAYAKDQNWEKVDDKKREEIATDWWAEKEKGEKAPVSRPDGTTKAGKTKPTGDKPKFTGVEDAIEKFKEDMGETVKGGARF